MVIDKIRSLKRNYPMSADALGCYNVCLCGRPGPNSASWESGWDAAVCQIIRILENSDK